MAARQASATNNDAKIPENNKSCFFEGPASRGLLFYDCRSGGGPPVHPGGAFSFMSFVETSSRRRNHSYSLRSEFTGFATAARTACTAIVTTAIPTTNAPATTNTHHPISIRYT